MIQSNSSQLTSGKSVSISPFKFETSAVDPFSRRRTKIHPQPKPIQLTISPWSFLESRSQRALRNRSSIWNNQPTFIERSRWSMRGRLNFVTYFFVAYSLKRLRCPRINQTFTDHLGIRECESLIVRDWKTFSKYLLFEKKVLFMLIFLHI